MVNIIRRVLNVVSGGKIIQSTPEEKSDRSAQMESQALARAIGERELSRPDVEAEQARQLGRKGYLSEEEQEAIRLKVEQKQRFARGPAGETLAQLKAEAREMAEDTRPGFVERQLQRFRTKPVKKQVRYRLPKVRKSRRKAPRARSQRRRTKKPTSAAMQIKMAKLRAMQRQPVRQPIQRQGYVPQARYPIIRMPSVREMQQMPTVRHLLPESERQRVDNLAPSFQKTAAIDYLRIQNRQRELMNKRQRKSIARAAPSYEQKVEISMFTGKPVLRVKNIKQEAWTKW